MTLIDMTLGNRRVLAPMWTVREGNLSNNDCSSSKARHPSDEKLSDRPRRAG